MWKNSHPRIAETEPDGMREIPSLSPKRFGHATTESSFKATQKNRFAVKARAIHLGYRWNFLMLGMIAEKIRSSFGFSTD